MMRMDADLLVGHKLLHGESPAAVEWLLDAMEERHLQIGDVLLTTGEKNDLFFLIFEGNLRVELEVEGKVTITHLRAGDCAGELSVLDEKGTAAYVVADQPSFLMAITRSNVWRLINSSHIFARNLLYVLSSRVRNDNLNLEESLLVQRRFEKNSLIDFLTGLFNRRWLDQMLPRLQERTVTGGCTMGMVMIDIDHFKLYNDTHGHLAGDEVLRAAAATIVHNIRPTDSAVRYGGEEFLVLLPESEQEDALAEAERLCKALRQLTIVDLDGNKLPGITVSIGVTTLHHRDQCSKVIDVADKALYKAKESGRDRVVLGQ